MLLAVSTTSLITCLSRYTRNIMNNSDTEKVFTHIETNRERWNLYKKLPTEQPRVGFPLNLYYQPDLLSQASRWFSYLLLVALVAPMRYHASNMRSVTSIWRLQLLPLTPCQNCIRSGHRPSSLLSGLVLVVYSLFSVAPFKFALKAVGNAFL
jgi:hypothetical protein